MGGGSVITRSRKPVVPGGNRAQRSLYLRYLAEPFYYISPAILLIGVVMMVPLIIGISYSFQSIELLNPFKNGWIGFENYVDLWSDRKFWIMSETIQRASSVSSKVSTTVMGSPPARSVRSVFPFRSTFSAMT